MRSTASRPTMALALSLLLTFASAGIAAELAGVTMGPTAEAGEESLHLNGMGLRKKIGFKVYAAGLYLPEKASDTSAILGEDTARRLDMHFLRKVSKDQLCGGWDDGLAANTPDASAEVKEAFVKLCSYMENVTKKDIITFVYVPGTGVEVTVKGASKGTLEGKAFADALFACWLGPTPPSDDFKAGLLGS